MNRIMVIGCGGAGKSTLSHRIYEITGLELIHLDKHFWLPDWIEPNKGVWEEKVIELSNAEL